jgi:asparagine synthase (glutamine-hydrolysing)
MNAQMQKRGPDGEGFWASADERVMLAHRRLAIIDLAERAAQPMHSEDGEYHIVFNGEIYNYQALRSRLMAQGQRFSTQSDTEVILALYARDGEKAFAQLIGMYAIAIYDTRRDEIILARDPYGIKPLYFFDDGWRFSFASSVKALLAGGVSRIIEPAAEIGFYLFGSVPEPWTWIEGVRAVPAGHSIRVNALGARMAKPFTLLANAFCDPTLINDDDLAALVKETLAQSVQRHRVADVEVGAFLSAGVDSTALVQLMCDQQQRVKTTTLQFAQYRDSANDEAPIAMQTAQRLACDHQTRTIGAQEFGEDLDAFLAAMDQPTLDGINTWMVAKAARERGLKIAVSGIGGDELLQGYPSFHELPKWRSMLALPAHLWPLPWIWRQSMQVLTRQFGLSAKLPALLELGGHWRGLYLLRRGLFMPHELPALIAPERLQFGLQRLTWQAIIDRAMQGHRGHAGNRVALLEANLYLRNQLLRDTDWASMAHGLEVRTPLVDIDVLHALAPHMSRFAQGEGKRILARSVGLPAAFSQRPKTGFTTPIASWLRDDARLQAWRRKPWLERKSQHPSRRYAVAIADYFF